MDRKQILTEEKFNPTIYLIKELGTLGVPLKDLGSIDASEHEKDDVDRVRQMTERELEITMLDFRSRKIVAIKQTLARLKAGIYWTCVDCKQEIPERRLRAIPTASRCITCQEAEDAQGTKVMDEEVEEDELEAVA